MKNKLLITLAALLSVMHLYAQNTVSGKITNEETGESVAYANVRISELNKGAVTDQGGSFEISNVPSGHYTLKVSYVGFEAQTLKIQVPVAEPLSIQLKPGYILREEVVVVGTRAKENMPITFQNVEKIELNERNLGQDLPFMLQNTPSLVTTSDAGTGVGYTGMRIRGSDATRINVTINGIPLNDSESQAVFWVNLPDFTSSLESVQVQRGVGTSTNGAGAFGASVNLQTSNLDQESSVQLNNSAGSFGTMKNTLILNSGQLNDHFTFEGRLSRIVSDGYIDRARADLKSFYLSGQYANKKTVIKALAFGGAEETYQSWNGVTEDLLETDRTFNSAGLYFDENGDQQFYDQEVDDYRQDHYQLHVSHQFNENWNAHLGLHYTYGRGFFEQFRQDDDFADYGLDNPIIGNDTITSGDFIRRRWLDNDFYGAVYSINYETNKSFLTIGGGIHQYDGDHFGEIIWAEYATDLMIRDRYYESVGNKTDFNTFIKYGTDLTNRLNAFVDAQIRTVNYSTVGINDDLRPLDISKDFFFFNPKFGLNYKLSNRSAVYASYAIGNREPDRNDFTEATGDLPKHEQLRNLEVGYTRNNKKLSWSLNYYLMDYKNQLVLTGELNDVGGAIRTNVPDSYRTGVEIQTNYQIFPKLNWEFNITFSQNKIRDFVEQLDEFDGNFNWIGRETVDHGDTDIAFSPQVISASAFRYTPIDGLNISLLSQYVGEQFLNNASDEGSILDAYFINDLKVSYDVPVKGMKLVQFNLLINNLLDHEYESNGWNYSYFSQGERGRINGFYPQAGINFLAGINLTF